MKNNISQCPRIDNIIYSSVEIDFFLNRGCLSPSPDVF